MYFITKHFLPPCLLALFLISLVIREDGQLELTSQNTPIPLGHITQPRVKKDAPLTRGFYFHQFREDPRFLAIQKARKDHRFLETLRLLDRLDLENPNHPYLLFYRGLVHYELKGNDQANQYFLQAISSESQFATPYLYLGMLAKRKGKLDKASFLMDKTLTLHPNYPYALFQRGKLHYQLREFSMAIKDLTQAESLSGNSLKGPVLNLLGQAQWAMGYTEEAEVSWRRSIDFAPASLEARQNLIDFAALSPNEKKQIQLEISWLQ